MVASKDDEKIALALLDDLDTAIRSGNIANSSKEQLNKFASVLCLPWAHNRFSGTQFAQICEVVRTHIVRAHIKELHNHITSLNKRNSITQYCVIALTIVSLIGSAVQIWYAEKADQRSLSQQSYIAPKPEIKTITIKHDTEANQVQLKNVPKIYQATSKEEVSK